LLLFFGEFLRAPVLSLILGIVSGVCHDIASAECCKKEMRERGVKSDDTIVDAALLMW